MKTITPEAANESIRRLLEEGELQEPSVHLEDSVSKQEKRPLSWSDFLAILVSYCHARQWEISYDSPDEFSVAIFAHEGQATDGAEARQGCLLFEDDSLPF